MFIDPQIEKNSIPLCDLSLCQLRLQKDGELDWMILIPKRTGLVEWSDLSAEEQNLLTGEIDFTCRLLKAFGMVEKLNIGSLGNIVPQLHIHIVGRRASDRAWPGPIWGTVTEKLITQEREKFWQEKASEVKKQFYKV